MKVKARNWLGSISGFELVRALEDGGYGIVQGDAQCVLLACGRRALMVPLVSRLAPEQAAALLEEAGLTSLELFELLYRIHDSQRPLGNGEPEGFRLGPFS